MIKKILFGLFVFMLAAISQATTYDVQTVGDYSTRPTDNSVTVLTSQAVSINDPDIYGPQSVYWYDSGFFSAPNPTQDSSCELITVNDINDTPVTIGGKSYTILTVTRNIIPKAHKINHTNSIRFTTSLATATATQSPTNSPTNTPTLSPTNTPTISPTNTPTGSFTPTATNTPTISPTNSPTNTPTNSPTNTPTKTPTPTFTVTATNSPTVTPTAAPTEVYDIYQTIAISNLPSGGNIGTAPNTVDYYSSFTVNQTTRFQTITLPSPTITTAGLVVYVNNIGTQSFVMYGNTILPGAGTILMWTGGAWSVMGH